MRELPITTRIIQTETGQCLMLRYIILVEELADGVEVYGIKITGVEHGTAVSVLGVTASAQRIQTLAALLARNTVTPIALADVLADWL